MKEIMVNKPVVQNESFPTAIDMIDSVMHVNQVRDVDLISYWTGKVVLAIGQGQEAVKEVIEHMFHRTYGDTFGLAYDAGVSQGKWEQKQLRKVRPSRSKLKAKRIRITASVGAARKMKRNSKKGK